MQESNEKEYEVKNTVAINYLNDLNAMITRGETQRLLFVEAHGHCVKEQPGIPKFIMKQPADGSRNDLLEFDFVVVPTEGFMRESLNYEIKVVFHLEQLPLQPKWIKVNAARNADIVRVNEFEE